MPLTPQQAKNLAQQLLIDDENAPTETQDAPQPPIPQKIGQYRILRLIATGGMGSVYEALQANPQRVVAMKILKRGIVSRTVLRRFDHEAAVLARLRHPGIAEIYEAGTHKDPDSKEAVPYFVMEYIPNATTITQYATEHKLSIRQRMELFTQVCDAVHYGHQKGIIHRDLKPANILVENTGDNSGGRVKVIDFGIARATDTDIAITTLQTDVRELIGTLQYMSPEQCSGDPHDIDIRSDIYSLGIVLYELLCEQLPYDLHDTALPHATRMVQECDPPRPSSISKTLRGDLEAIVLKALEKKRQQRYQTTVDLCRDILRFLAGEPIQARPPSRWSLAMGWVTHHPVLTTTAACLLIAMLTVGATSLSVWILNSRPYEMMITADGREARLKSLGGKIIYKWQEEAENSIRFAELVDRTTGFGGGKLAIVGFNSRAKSKYAGAMCAFDANDPASEPVWQSAIKLEEIIEPFLSNGFKQRGFGIRQHSKVADVFPDLDGLEIIAVYSHNPRSAAIIRILDMQGKILYEIWHDGAIADVAWLPGNGQIVAIASNSEALWSQRGYSNLIKPNPIVVFAAHAELNYRAAQIISDSLEGGLTTIEYYRCLLPTEAVDWFVNFNFSLGHPDDNSTSRVRLDLHLFDSPNASLSFLIDKKGNVVPESQVPSDQYILERERNPDLPDPTTIHLGKLPPIISTPATDEKIKSDNAD